MPRRPGWGLSARVLAAIGQVDREYFWPRATERALLSYREFLTSGRWPLYPQLEDCPCDGCSLDDVRVARDVIEEVLRRLPPRERAELRRLVSPMDRRYLALTLPDPFARNGLWWHQRLAAEDRGAS
ncbi:MAG: hypothetical protein ACRD0H_00615 [Actinomycetes bacterium]